MFNVGPFEMIVLAIVAIIVIGPDRLPGMARDAARMLRTLREMATGARQQLRDELGPEFADLDLRSLDPRAAVKQAVFGDDPPDFTKYDPRRLNPGAAVRDAIFGEDAAAKPVSMTKAGANGAPGPSTNGTRPRPSPRPRINYDEDAT